MVQEGCPYIAALCATQLPDVWSARNQRLSPDGGVTPAAGREGNRDAQWAAYRSGMVFRGKIDIPLIDWRHYLEPFLDMHNSHQSFASRQRMLNYDGNASNQLIWFTAAPPPGSSAPRFDQTPQALLVLDEWLANIEAHPLARAWQGTSRRTRSTRASRPTARCSHAATTSGTGSSTADRRARARSSSRRSRPRGSSPAARSRAASSSATSSPSRPRSRRGVYGSWQPDAGRAGAPAADLPDAGSATTRSGDAGMPPELAGAEARPNG